MADLFHGGAVKVKDGFAELPDRPGLGVDLDEKLAAQRPYKPASRGMPAFGDGAPADN
jgi:L-alanine-DL-glutamate epimerase-like enolase superfamily enzyme